MYRIEFNPGPRRPNQETVPSEEELWSQLERVFARFDRMAVNTRRNDENEFFYDPGEPEELVQICTRLAKIMHDHAYQAVCFTDRSARPAYLGLKASWAHKYPGEPEPEIFFLNPTGFVDSLTAKQRYDKDRTIKEYIVRHAGNRDNAMDADLTPPRNVSEIDAEVTSVFGKYIGTDSPILIFDTCIHDGGTIRPIKKTFDRLGIGNAFCVVTNRDNESRVKPDYIIINGRPAGGCYPFEHDALTQRHFGSIFAQPSEDSDQREESRRIRTELRTIFEHAPDEWFYLTKRSFKK